MGLQELKSLGGVLYSVQPMLPEAGGQVGEVPVAVSWVWHPGAPCGGGFEDSGEGLLPPFPACWGHGGRACEFTCGRLGAAHLGVYLAPLGALEGLPAC